jgi:hypothetical protein
MARVSVFQTENAGSIPAVGSNLLTEDKRGVAQLVAQVTFNHKVVGSIPISPTNGAASPVHNNRSLSSRSSPYRENFPYFTPKSSLI